MVTKIFCDRCGRELPTKRKKKFLGLINYIEKDTVYSMYWGREREL